MLAVTVAAAAFLTLTEAFGLQVIPLPERFLYWLALLGSGVIGSQAIRRSLDRLPLPPLGLVRAGFLRAGLLSIPVTILAWLATCLALSQPLRAARLAGFYVPVLVVTAGMACVYYLVQGRPAVTSAASAGPGNHLPAILARVPPRLRGCKLLAVQAEDHYVRLHTSDGSDLVLLRFADALAELRGIEGAQVHRSWWVARDAVVCSRRENGKTFLLLPDGTRAPVSRSFVRELKTEGWL